MTPLVHDEVCPPGLSLACPRRLGGRTTTVVMHSGILTRRGSVGRRRKGSGGGGGTGVGRGQGEGGNFSLGGDQALSSSAQSAGGSQSVVKGREGDSIVSHNAPSAPRSEAKNVGDLRIAVDTRIDRQRENTRRAV